MMALCASVHLFMVDDPRPMDFLRLPTLSLACRSSVRLCMYSYVLFCLQGAPALSCIQLTMLSSAYVHSYVRG